MRSASVSRAPINEADREIVRCPNCDGAEYPLGRYDEHVRSSTHSNHERDKGFMVDLAGAVHPNVRSGTFGR